MLRIGTILRGIYRIDSYLSSGGFGNTYVATNIEFDERVAIKEFFIRGVTQRDDNQTTVSVSNSENQDSFLQQREKFKKEARRIRQLNSPHIVKVHDLFEENGTAYYVMDFIDGENLSERLRRIGRPMTEEEVKEILPQILDALQTVHDAGMWHLDLKPANIMVDKAGQVKLIDFGASKQLNAQKGGATTSTAISYTNGYAPREQMEQNYDKFGPWTDFYALGATLYKLLTNNQPPMPTDIDDDLREDKHTALPMANVSEGMKRLILWLMKTNRMERPKTIQEIKELKIEEKPINVSPPISSEKREKKEEETIIVSKTEVPKKDNIQTSITQLYTEESNSVQDDNKDNHASRWILLIVCSVIGMFWLLGTCNSNKSSEPMEPEVEVVDTTVVDTAIIDDSQNSGYNKINYADGSTYEGYVENGLRNGQGTLVWPDGQKYEGNWINDERTGYGTYLWPEKRRGYMYKYVGNFKNGEMEGNGTAYYVGGFVESGIWKKSELVSSDSQNGNNQENDKKKDKPLSTSEDYYKIAKSIRSSNGFTAIEHFKKAYSIGTNPWKIKALFQIGITYYYGLGGVNIDYEEARSYFYTAAQSGNNEAKYYLGICYEYGRGCPKDKNLAEFWFISSGYSSTPSYNN